MQPTPLWPLVAYALILLVLMVAVLMATHVLGERHNAPAADLPFESGIVGVGGARLRLSAKFYLIAMFFVIFDVEAVFVEEAEHHRLWVVFHQTHGETS